MILLNFVKREHLKYNNKILIIVFKHAALSSVGSMTFDSYLNVDSLINEIMHIGVLSNNSTTSLQNVNRLIFVK